MATNATNADKFDDSRIDYEKIARREKVFSLRRHYDDDTHAAFDDFATALSKGDGERQAFLAMVQQFNDLLTHAADDLEQLGEFDRQDPEYFLMVRALDVAACAARGRTDLAAGFAADVAGAVDELDQATDEEVADALEVPIE